MPHFSLRPRALFPLFVLCAVSHSFVSSPAIAQTASSMEARALPNLALNDGLRLQISTEAATGIFLERDTLRTQTPIEWTLRAWNTLPQDRKLRVSWRVIDATGKEISRRTDHYDFPSGQELRRPNFFEPKALGAYRIEVEATAPRKGRDDVMRAHSSFAVIASPIPLSSDVAVSPLSTPSFTVENAVAPGASDVEWFRALNVPIQMSDSVAADALFWPAGLSGDNDADGESANAWRFITGQVANSRALLMRDSVVVEPLENPINAVSASVKRSVLTRVAGGKTSTRWPQMLQNPLARMASGAAWAQMVRLLENATPEGRLFAPSPLLWGTSFSSGTSRIVVMWNDAGDSRLVTKLAGARVLDLWGNEITRSRDNGELILPLSSQPVYVLTSAPVLQVQEAWRIARLEGTAPVAARILPFTRPIPGDGKNLPRVTVRVQNVSWAPFTGSLQLELPKGWKAATPKLALSLNAGESKTLSFALAQAKRTADDVYIMSTHVERGRSDWKQKQAVPTSTVNVSDDAVQIDGALGEWQNATWMNIGDRSDATQARVALRADANNLYVAAQVSEDSLQVRDENASEYSFWNSDALQIAFGVRSDAASDNLGARDSDYGFLLSPFSAIESGAPIGRVLRLWSPQFAFSQARDRVRWGGVVAGSLCALRRDETNKLTTWEAMIPLSSVPELQPARRLNANEAVRFGWVLHNEQGAALEWNAANSFAWTRNSGSFMPINRFSAPLQTSIGFSRGATAPVIYEPADVHFDGSIWNPPTNSSVAQPTPPKPSVSSSPTPVAQPTPTPAPTPKPTPTPTPTPRPTPSSTPLPPVTAPLPPQSLPPLPPAPPASSLPQLPPPPTN